MNISRCHPAHVCHHVAALTQAAYYGKTEVVVELVKAGANLDLQNKVHCVCVCQSRLVKHNTNSLN